MTRPVRVLVADDERHLREVVVRELARRGHAAEGAADGEEALARLGEGGFDVLVLDMKMPRREGLDVLRALSAQPEAPQVIVMTGFHDVATAVEAMKLGAYDYLTKPARIEELDVLIRKAAEKGQLLRDNRALRAHADPQPYGPILTRSPRMQEVLRIVERVAPTESSVLVLGESGTGKELVARAIHERSPRAGRPFVPIHCGALPREVLESELFGHERGAFTGAVSAKPGLIELADGVRRLSPAALEALERYPWPGNVRELQHAIERAVILARGQEIQPEDLPPELLGATADRAAPAGGTLEAMERAHIVATLRRVGGHRGKAAALLAIDPKTLYRKVLAYRMTPDEWK